MLHTELDKLVAKLQSIGRVSEPEEAGLRELPMEVRQLASNRDIVREGAKPSQCCLVLDGFVCRYKNTAQGKRQIMSFHTPGDIPDLQSLHLETMDHSIGTLVPTKMGFISHENLCALIAKFPRLGNLFWRDTLIDAAIFREWMVGLGRRNSHSRIAHLICEMFMRFKAVGLAGDASYNMPTTQAELGDALGLTVVHVNRVLRDLREAGLVIIENPKVSILNWEKLVELGEFEKLYLHQD